MAVEDREIRRYIKCIPNQFRSDEKSRKPWVYYIDVSDISHMLDHKIITHTIDEVDYTSLAVYLKNGKEIPIYMRPNEVSDFINTVECKLDDIATFERTGEWPALEETPAKPKPKPKTKK